MGEKLKKAIEIAETHHKWQLRRDGSLYIDHPLRVMWTLKKYNFPEEALIAAILHDICEDTDISNLQINELFGTRVWFIVNALSKNKKPKNNDELKKEYKKKQAERKVSNLQDYNNFEEYKDYRFHLYINRLYTWMIADPWIFFIKIADQIDNLSDIEPFTEEKRFRKIKEVENFFLPIYRKIRETFKINKEVNEKYDLFINLLTEKIKDTKKKYNINY